MADGDTQIERIIKRLSGNNVGSKSEKYEAISLKPPPGKVFCWNIQKPQLYEMECYQRYQTIIAQIKKMNTEKTSGILSNSTRITCKMLDMNDLDDEKTYMEYKGFIPCKNEVDTDYIHSGELDKFDDWYEYQSSKIEPQTIQNHNNNKTQDPENVTPLCSSDEESEQLEENLTENELPSDSITIDNVHQTVVSGVDVQGAEENYFTNNDKSKIEPILRKYKRKIEPTMQNHNINETQDPENIEPSTMHNHNINKTQDPENVRPLCSADEESEQLEENQNENELPSESITIDNVHQTVVSGVDVQGAEENYYTNNDNPDKEEIDIETMAPTAQNCSEDSVKKTQLSVDNLKSLFKKIFDKADSKFSQDQDDENFDNEIQRFSEKIVSHSLNPPVKDNIPSTSNSTASPPRFVIPNFDSSSTYTAKEETKPLYRSHNWHLKRNNYKRKIPFRV